MDERSSSPEVSGPALAETGDATDRLEALETRARDARGATEDRPAAEAGRLAELELDLLALSQDLSRAHPHLADDRGHPVLADLGRWQSRCRRLGLEAADQKAAALHADFVDDEAERWRRAVKAAAGRADPQACLDLLTEAAVLDGENLSRQGEQPGSPPLAGERGPLREGFAAAIEAHPPTDDDRDRWATALLDRADVVLTAIDELAPAAADAQLGIVADDLSWHLLHVETERSSRRGQLKRKLRRVIAEQQERGLQGRLEGMFGRVNVGRFEQLILWLIFLVLALLAVESIFEPSEQVKEIFLVVDTLACLVFLWDFFLRLTLVQGKGRWFLRHFFVDFLPSIPVGLLAWQPIRLGRALRFLRLARVARYVRFLMPVIRLVRAVGFLSRGVDRVVRRYGHLLNRDVILYPTREEKARVLAARQDTVMRLRRLHAEVNDLWADLLSSAHGADRDAVAATRVDGLARARERGLAERPAERAQRVVATREIPAEILLRRLECATAEGIAADLGTDFISRAARAVRVFSRPPLRWIPFLRGWFPQLGPAMSDAEITAATAHQAAARLRRHHDRWFWFADLYGTITPAEFVDGVGSTMVRSALRPAYKLVLFGGGYLLVLFFLLLLPGGFFEWLRQILEKLLGNTLLVLGGICAVILGIGWWLRRLAQQATAFFEQVALAQYLPLTESIKGRFLERDAALFARRVLAPEFLLKGEVPERVAPALRDRFVRGVRSWLLEAHASGDARGAFDAMERAVLLYRDGLDGGRAQRRDRS